MIGVGWMIACFVSSFAVPEIQTFLPGIGAPIHLEQFSFWVLVCVLFPETAWGSVSAEPAVHTLCV